MRRLLIETLGVTLILGLLASPVFGGLAYDVMAPVVKLWAGGSSGSGVVMKSGKSRTLIVTNAHVVGKEETVKVIRYFWDEDKSRIIGSVQVSGSVLCANEGTDVAVIEIDGWLEWPTAQFEDARLELLGKVMAVGAPFYEDVQILRGVVTDQDRKGLIQHDSAILPGFSGGALWAEVDGKWKVVGLLNAGFRGTRISFAIPSRLVKICLKKCQAMLQ